MTIEEIRRLEEFDFCGLLHEIKDELGISFKEMAKLSDIPYVVLYKYTSNAKPRPSLIDFFKIMAFANKSLDECYLKMLDKNNTLASVRRYIKGLHENELQLLDKLNKLSAEQQSDFIDHMLVLLDMISEQK